MKNLPFSPSCERNKDPILEHLTIEMKQPGEVLEVGHGTGQHAIYFSKNLSHLKWTPTDREENNGALKERLIDEDLPNLYPPYVLEVGELSLEQQTTKKFDYIFTANTLHIMAEDLAQKFCEEVGSILRPGGKLLIYGPFKFEGEFTSSSNAQFDQSLKGRSSNMGIRNFEDIKKWIEKGGPTFLKRHDLPANNHILVFSAK